MTRHSALKPVIVSLVVLLGLPASILAQATSHFTDGDANDSNWTTSGNWDPAVPDDQTAAYIGGGKTAEHAANTAQSESLILGHDEGAGTLNLGGGTLNVVNSIINGAGASTISVTGEPTLSVGGTMAVDTLHVAYDVVEGTLAFTTETRPDEIIVGVNETDRGSLVVGYTEGGGLSSNGTLNLAEVPKLTAYLNQFIIGRRRRIGSDGSSGAAVGIVTLADENYINASTVLISQNEYWSPREPKSTLNLGAVNTFEVDTFTVAGWRAQADVILPSGGELNLTGPNGDEADLLIANNNIGTSHAGLGTMDLSAGTFNATLGQLLIGYHRDGAGDGMGTLSFAAGEVTAGSLALGGASASHGTGTGIGTLNMSGGELEVTGNVTLGTGSTTSEGTINMTGGTLEVTGNVTGGVGTSTLNITGGDVTLGGNLDVNELIVGDDKGEASFTADGENKTLAIGKLTVAADSATGTFTAGTGAAVEIGTAAGPTDLFIARKTDAVALSGTVDLSAADSLVAHLDRLFMAYQTTSLTPGGNTATLKLAGTNEIFADHILLGLVESGATTVTSATVELGETNTILADTLTIGGGKSTGTVKFAGDVTGGVLNLGTESARVDLNIGYNVPLDTSWSTSRTATGHLDGSGGTINAWLGDVVIGYHGVSGTGKGVGTLTIDSGTVDANSIFMGHGIGTNPQNSEGTIELTGGTISVHGDVTSGSGNGTLIINDGSMTVGGNLEVSALRVGRDQSTATLTVNGNDVRIGTETGRSDLIVGYTEGDNLHSEGALNLENVSNLTAYLDDFMIGWRRTSSDGSGTAKGTVTLAENNYIDAATIVVSQNEYWNIDPESVLTLGADNTLKVDTFTVAGWRANGRVDLPEGGVLNLSGSSGAATDLLIADNNIGTGHDGVGIMDLSAGTFNATLNKLQIGFHRDGGGSGTGILSFAGGEVTANSVVLGHTTNSSSGTGVGTLNIADGSLTVDGPVTLGTGSATSQGTINLSGGALWADSITKGVGQAVFDWTGGTLSVGTFGFDLAQNGGTLAPGNSIGETTVDGHYTMNDGTLEIEIAGPESHDFVMVYGDAMLAGDFSVLLLNEYVPALGTHFDVLQTTGDLQFSELALADASLGSTFGWWDLGAVASGDGYLLRLSAVPEPSSTILLLLGLAVLIGRRQRRRP